MNQDLVISELGMVGIQVIQTLEKQRQEEQEFGVISGDSVSLRPAWAKGNLVSKTQNNNKNHNCFKLLPQKATGRREQVGNCDSQ